MPSEPMLFVLDEADAPANLHDQLAKIGESAREATEAEGVNGNGDIAIPQAELFAVPDGFYPDTEAKVEWVVGEINDDREAIRRIKQNSEARVKAKQRRIDFFLAAYTEPLRAWAQEHLPRRGRSVALDNGKLAFTVVPRRIEISDDDALALALAEQIAPDLIIEVPATRKVNRLELAKRMQIVERGGAGPAETFSEFWIADSATGEIIESEAVTITEPSERFAIK